MKERSIFMHLYRRSKLAWYDLLKFIPSYRCQHSWEPALGRHVNQQIMCGPICVAACWSGPSDAWSVDFCTTRASNCLIRLINTLGPSAVQRIEIYQINNYSNVRIYSLGSLI
jgi:hypothetical protein